MRFAVKMMALVICIGATVPRASAQVAETMMPEQSAAKAKHVLDQLIDAMGGQAYLNTRETDCTGRLAQFEHNGNLSGYTNFRDYWHLPDKNRTEYEMKGAKGGFLGVLIGQIPFKGGTIIELYNGDEGWTMDKSGVNEADVTVVEEFQNSLKRQIWNLLLKRASDKDTFLYYAGIGIADMREVEWIDFNDADDNKVRVALDHGSHLPLRVVATTANEEMHDRDEDVTIYSNYRDQQGIQTAMQISREHNGRRTRQIFFNSCTNAPNLPTNFFSEDGLRQQFKATGAKVKAEK